ncbi:hypothetical protein [Magnetospirillum sp. SS-4]|uniref:hypothetical protein n=1 Tax=Magnetospirillum sp. SS-4 TaxID=2681465 RepID=UPI00137E90EB|nr:hypothetical protein [Magnetospirillum sp. SS-4]CAA7622286.1 putative transmembrane protein [Magnetospirillum sp. SS-4]
MDAHDRFKKRLALSSARNALLAERDASSPEGNLPTSSADYSQLDQMSGFDAHPPLQAEADALLVEITGKLDEEKLSNLFEACQKECLQAVIRPFGLGRILFDDMLGGNVATIHNVRSEEYRKENITAWSESGEKAKFESRPEYKDVKHKYKQDSRYIDANAKISKKKLIKHGGVINDTYTDESLGINEDRDLDHVVPTSEIHNDAGIYLADLDPIALANIQSNLKATNASINRSKNGDSAKKFAERLRKQSETRKEKINKLSELSSLTDEQAKELNKLKHLDEVNEKKLLAADDAARKEINGSVNNSYYTSNKFIKNTAITSAKEGGKMALQQSVGVLMEEFVRAAFAEVKDAWKHGFKERVDDTFLDALKVRLLRVAERVQNKWKDAVGAFKAGFISGFLSNLVTVIINMFRMTSARMVRIIREGFMSLCRAMKMLVLPPEGMSAAEAADAASKLLAASLVTGGGIMLETALEGILTSFGPLAPYISSISVGLVTGLCTVFSAYLLDRLDLFGVHASSRHEHVVARLNEMIDESYERALESSNVFDGPALLHLT